MQNDIDIFRGIKRNIQKYPADFRPAGQWLDDFCQNIVNQAEQRRQKLPQIKSAVLKKIQSKKSLLENVQHEREKLRKIIAGHEHNDEKFEEEKQRLSTLDAEANQLTFNVPKLGRKLKNFTVRTREPGFILLMSKASEKAFCEYPRNHIKIMVIAWLLTDEYLSESKLGITKYEQYVFHHEVREPEGNGPQRLVSEQEMAKDAVLARPGAMEKTRDAYLSYENSGGKAEDNFKITKLTDFITNNCEDTQNLLSKVNRIHEFVKHGKILFMPKPINKPKGNQTKLYYEEELRKSWPQLKLKIKSLPNLKA
ncbi:MAG: hypothetical protein FVQ85_15110 [Planctomycetes bacterium]|nr:hypothetical protein [Planctomycetota bacterium]